MKTFTKMTDILNDHLIHSITSKACYTGLFKVFVALGTLYLFVMWQSSVFIEPIESHAYELKFTTEAETKKIVDSFDKLECKVEMKTYKECQLAKHKGELSENMLDASDYILAGTALFAKVAIILSFIVFLLHPYIHKQDDQPKE